MIDDEPGVELPHSAGPFPTLLVCAPRWRAPIAGASQAWLDAGFAVVTDHHGPCGLDGGLSGSDSQGWDVLAWVVDQPWCDRRVVCAGTAYDAEPAWWAAASGHPSVAAVVVRQPWVCPGTAGPFRLEDELLWLADHAHPESRAGSLSSLHETLRGLLLAGPLAGLADRWPGPLAGWPLGPPARPCRPRQSNGPGAERGGGPEAAIAALAAAGVPSLHLASWFCPSAVASLAQAEVSGPSATVIAGPWVSGLTHRLAPHCVLAIEPAQVPCPEALAASWAAELLAGADPRSRGRAPGQAAAARPTPSQQATGRSFLLGSHRWVSLDPRGATVSRQLTAWAGGARGRLRAPGVPGQASPPTVLVHDPGDPFPSSRHSDDHRLPVARADVVSWFSASLAGPLGWFGRAQCRMEVCAPTHGCDVVVTLLHERAGGERTRLLDSAVEVAAGRTKVVVTFPPAAVEIPAGHRIGVEVTTSRFPRFARAIPGADRWQAASGPTVEITVAPAAGGLLWLPEVTWPSDAAAPARPSGEELGAGSNLATLVDERTGVVTAVEPVATAPGAPPWAHLYAGAVADIGAHLPWPADRVTTGMAVADRQRAWSSAVGEAVERYCGNFVPAGLRRASFDELAREGRAAVDPRTLALYSPSQHAAPGFPFEPFTTGLRVRWAEGYTLDDGLPVLVPASLAYVNYHHLAGEGEPLTNYVNLAGIAAGPDLQAAETAAMEELMERDATMIWWHNALAARPVEVDDLRLAPWLRPCPELGPGWAQAAGVESPWRYRLVAIPTTLDVAVIGALVHDPEAGIVGLGVAARPDPVAAVHKAIVEAVSLHFYACGLDDPAGAIWELSESGLFDGSVLKPHRADRRYRDDYRSDWRDVLDLACHSQLWLDPRMEPALAPIVGEAPPVTLDRLPKVTGDVRAGYIRRLLAQGLRPCAVDMTTPDVAATGARVVRVVAPGAYSNPPAAFAFLGGRRLYTDPVVLGLREVAAEEEELVLAPLPHT